MSMSFAEGMGGHDPGVTYEKIVFCDGSTYVGTLKGMQPDGLGTCTWRDGNQYDGEWKAGTMHGFGTYIWTSGQRYDGEWKEGKRDGIGVKRYADGSTFDGFWKDGKKHGVGVFRPAQGPPLTRTGSAHLHHHLKRPSDLPSRISPSRLRNQPLAEEQLQHEHMVQPPGRSALAHATGTTMPTTVSSLGGGGSIHHQLVGSDTGGVAHARGGARRAQQRAHAGEHADGALHAEGGGGGLSSLSGGLGGGGAKHVVDARPFTATSQAPPSVSSRHTSGGLLVPHEWAHHHTGTQRQGTHADESVTPARGASERAPSDASSPVRHHPDSTHGSPHSGGHHTRDHSPGHVTSQWTAEGATQHEHTQQQQQQQRRGSEDAVAAAAAAANAMPSKTDVVHAAKAPESLPIQGLEFTFDADQGLLSRALKLSTPPPPLPPAQSVRGDPPFKNAQQQQGRASGEGTGLASVQEQPQQQQQAGGVSEERGSGSTARARSLRRSSRGSGKQVSFKDAFRQGSTDAIPQQQQQQMSEQEQAQQQQGSRSLHPCVSLSLAATEGMPASTQQPHTQLQPQKSLQQPNQATCNSDMDLSDAAQQTVAAGGGGEHVSAQHASAQHLQQQQGQQQHKGGGHAHGWGWKMGRRRADSRGGAGSLDGDGHLRQQHPLHVEGSSQDEEDASHAAESRGHPMTQEAVAALDVHNMRHEAPSGDLSALRRLKGHTKSGLPADSVLTGPAHNAPGDNKVLYIRRFNEGKLEREDRFTHEEMKLIFKDVWTKPKRDEPRIKTLGRHVKKAVGMGKKLEEKQGQLIYKGMPGYDLMIRLQLGIRYSIGRVNQVPVVPVTVTTPTGNMATVPQAVELPLKPEDFLHKAKVFFPQSGSSTTPAHPSSDFKWKDYSPRVFRRLRAAWGINDAEYMLSLGGSQALRQLNSPGKSGCMFFLSDDERFLIKTMRKSELKILQEMLPKYFEHMESHPQSLVTHFFGVHGVKDVHGRTVRFMIMSNIFCTELQIHKKFDLKGSTFERTAGAANPNDPKSVFKDLDLDLSFKLPKELHDRLGQQFSADAAFLQAIGVMDYSLLLGVHICSRARPHEGLGIAHSGRHDRHVSLLDGQASLESNKQGKEGKEGKEGENGPTLVGKGVSHAGPVPCPPTPHHPEQCTDGIPKASPIPPHLTHHSRASSGTPSLGTPAKPPTGPTTPARQPVHGNVAGGKGVYTPGAPPANGGVLRPVHTRRWQSDSITERGGSISRSGGAHPAQYLAQYQGAGQEGGGAFGTRVGGKFTPRITQDSADVGTEWSAPPAIQSKNFDVFSNREELSVQLAAVEARMRQLKYSEQRIQDVLGLAKLKILGDKLNKRDRRRHKGQHTQSQAVGVVKAIAQARQETDAEEVITGPHALHTPFMHAASAAAAAGGKGDERTSGAQTPFTLMLGDGESASGSESDDGAMTRDFGMPLAHAGAASMICQRTQLGFNMPAVAIHHSPLSSVQGPRARTTSVSAKSEPTSKSARDSEPLAEGAIKGSGGLPSASELENQGEEEVLLYFGIIDILQEYNARKFMERGMKAVMHDKYAISVAPPDTYAIRFMNFMRQQVFPQPLPETQAPLQAMAVCSSLMRLPVPLASLNRGDVSPHDPQGWASAELDPLDPHTEEPESATHSHSSKTSLALQRSSRLCLPATLPEEQPSQPGSAQGTPHATSGDVRVEVVS